MQCLLFALAVVLLVGPVAGGAEGNAVLWRQSDYSGFRPSQDWRAALAEEKRQIAWERSLDSPPPVAHQPVPPSDAPTEKGTSHPGNAAVGSKSKTGKELAKGPRLDANGKPLRVHRKLPYDTGPAPMDIIVLPRGS